MRKFLFLLILLPGLISCVKEPVSQNRPGDGEIVVPSNFDWKISSDLTVSIAVTDINPATIRVYNQINGSLMASGTAVSGAPFVTTLSVSSAQSTLFVQKIGADRTVSEKTITTEQARNYTFPPLVSMKSKGLVTKSTPRTLPVFDLVVSNNADVDLGGWNTPYYQNVLIEGNYTGNFRFAYQSARTTTVYIRGNVSFASFYEGASAGNKIVVLDGGSLTRNNLPFNIPIEVDPEGSFLALGYYGYGKTLINYGTTVIENELSVYSSGSIQNYGDMEMKGIAGFSNTSSLANHGTLVFRKNVTFSVSAGFQNAGEIRAYEDFNATSSSAFNNLGSLEISQKLALSSNTSFTNGCYLSAQTIESGNVQSVLSNQAGALITTHLLSTSGGLTLNAEPGSIVQAENVYSENLRMNTPAGSGFALFGFDHTTLFRNAIFSGPIDVVHTSNETENSALYNMTLSNGATLSATQSRSIAQSDCNGGAGLIGGGVDPDPTEPNAYSPSRDGFNTIAFEDMWPKEGDYDMNDLVLAFNIGYFENNNQVSKMVINARVLAMGANLRNHGLGLQLDAVLPGNVKEVTWNLGPGSGSFSIDPVTGLEVGSTPAVLPIFNNVNQVIEITSQGNVFFNTELSGGSYGVGKPLIITIEFNEPVSKTNLTINQGLNFFMTIAGVRSKEVHAFGFSPTSKADRSFFGQNDDNSLSGPYYSTPDRFPWALIFPEIFHYPLERIYLGDAYLYYENWIMSNKQSKTDWYQTKPENIDASKLYPME